MPLSLDNLVKDRGFFFEEIWNRSPETFETYGLPTGTLTEAEVFDLLDCGLLSYPYVSLIKDGRAVEPSSTVTSRMVAGNRLPDIIDPVSVSRHFTAGATVRLNHPDHWHEASCALTRVLEAEFTAAVRSFAFLTPANSREPRKRATDAHAFIVQLSGSSHWYVGGLDNSTTNRFSLASGCSLYVPHGLTCEVETAEKTSLHLEFTVTEPTAEDTVKAIVEAIISRLDKDPRKDSHHLLSMAEKAQWVRDSMNHLLSRPDAKELVARAAMVQDRRG